MTLEPGARLGRYEVQALLGAGGMGEVYRARDIRLDRDVAIKVLPPRFASDGRLRERFDREARAIAALSHRNICPVFDVGEASSLFFVMELLEGETLEQRLRTTLLRPSEVLDLATQIASGLEAAHAKGIVHRDIKPGNIFITSSGEAKITDFGLATVAVSPALAASMAETGADVGLTLPGSALGTAAYMSPEQARGEAIDARTDIFAFGAVLFQMATGRAAFAGTTLATVFDAVLHVTPPLASELAPEIPASLSQVIAKALQKRREDRYQAIGDLKRDLQLVATGSSAPASGSAQPLMATTLTPGRARSAMKVAAAVAIAVLFVAAGAGFLYSRRIQTPAAVSGAPIRSLAVLPLENLSGVAATDYFTDGMTDELIAALARIRGWRVISRTSVMQYKKTRKPLAIIAQELGVDALIEGSVQQSADRVRIRAQLVRAGRDEQNLWADTFDREMKDVLDLQSDVAMAIVDQIKLTLTPREQEQLATRRPVDPDVFQLSLRGRAAADAGTEDGFFKAIGYFEQALAKNATYAPAHAAIALAYEGLTPSFRAPKEVLPKAREHAVKAIELDETLSEAHTALATVMFLFDWDWENAGKEMQRAIELNPNSSSAHELYSNYLTALNKKEPAIEEITLAHQLNPAGLPTYATLLANLTTLREYDRAIAEARAAIQLHPDFAFAHAWLGMALFMKGQIAEAIPELERGRQLDDNVTTTHFLAMAHAAAGNKGEAEKLVAGLEKAAATRYTCAYEVASVHLQLGNKEKAMQWLRRGVEEQCDCLVWLKTEAWIDPLRVDPRYADLVKRVGFPN